MLFRSVVGDGPDRARLQTLLAAQARSNVALLGRVSDEELRWLYGSCAALVAASYEDYGLSPLEAAAFGKPSVVLRDGGYLDTVVEGATGWFFDRPHADTIAHALTETFAARWDRGALVDHAETFGTQRFTARLRQLVDEQAQLGADPGKEGTTA